MSEAKGAKVETEEEAEVEKLKAELKARRAMRAEVERTRLASVTDEVLTKEAAKHGPVVLEGGEGGEEEQEREEGEEDLQE